MTPIYTFQLTGYFIEPGQARCQAQLRTLHYIIDKVDFRRVTTKMMIRYRADYWGRLINRRTDMPLMCELLNVHPKDRKACRCINGNRLDYRRSNWRVVDVPPPWLQNRLDHGCCKRALQKHLAHTQSQGADSRLARRSLDREYELQSDNRRLKVPRPPAEPQGEAGPDSATHQLAQPGQRL